MALEQSKAAWVDMLAQTGNDGNYRTKDYENGLDYTTLKHNLSCGEHCDWYAPYDGMVDTVSRLIAFHAVTKDGANEAAINKLMKAGKAANREEAEQMCQNINSAIVDTFNNGKLLMSAEIDGHEKDANAFAYDALKNLSDTLTDNNALSLVDEDIKYKGRLVPDTTLATTNDHTLFGQSFSNNTIYEGEKSTAYQFFAQMVDTFEKKTKEDIAKDLMTTKFGMRKNFTDQYVTREPIPGIRMLAKTSVDDAFMTSAEELNVGRRDRILVKEKDNAVTFEDMLGEAAKPETVSDNNAAFKEMTSDTPASKLEQSKAAWVDILAQTGNDGNYRTKDYESGLDYDTLGKRLVAGDRKWNCPEQNMTTTVARLVSLHAVTKDGADDLSKNRFIELYPPETYTTTDPEQSKQQCKNISEAIVETFNNGKLLAAVDIDGNEEATKAANAFAHATLQNLTSVLRDNEALYLANRDLRGTKEIATDDYALLGKLFGDYTDPSDPTSLSDSYQFLMQLTFAAEGIAPEELATKMETQNVLHPMSFNIGPKVAPNPALLMAFKDRPDEQFMDSARILNIGNRDRILVKEKDNAVTFEDMLGETAKPETANDNKATFEEMLGGADPKYNSDFQNYNVIDHDRKMADRVVAMFARTSLDEPIVPGDTDSEKRKAIADSIRNAIDSGRELFTNERLTDRVVQTGNTMITVQDDMSSDMEEKAAKILTDLGKSFAENGYMDYVTQDAKDEIGTANLVDNETYTSDTAFLGHFHTTPDLPHYSMFATYAEQTHVDENGNETTYSVRQPEYKDRLERSKFFEQATTGSMDGSYRTLMGLIKGIDEVNSGERDVALASPAAEKGTATRLLFKKEADANFKEAAQILSGQKDEDPTY